MQWTLLFILLVFFSLAVSYTLPIRSRIPTKLHLEPGDNEIVPISLAEVGRQEFTKYIPLIVTLVSIFAAKKATSVEAYLVEPTPEFKAEEAKQAAFIAKQNKIRQSWDATFDSLSQANTGELLILNLKEMTAFLAKTDGVPPGVKKIDVVKLCRSKKFVGKYAINPIWTVKVEIEYQNLTRQFNRNASPTTVI